jgi:hypothetical protein
MVQRKYLVLGTQYLAIAGLALTLFGPRSVEAAPPKVNYLFPAGGQRGQTVNVTAGGDFSSWPVQAWSDRPGLTATCEKDKGKLAIAVAADAAPGVYWLRLFSGDGASNLKPFVVGTLPEIAETEPNDAPEKPQTAEPHVVVNGKLGKTGDVDGYCVGLKQGETLVASLQANSVLGSPMDAVLQICELVERGYSTNQTRQVEAYLVSQNHDAVGLDPQLAFTAPHDGQYLVRLFAFPATPDSSVRFAGGEDYVYRLTLTTGPFIDHALPLALPREESPVQLGGWNLGSALTAIAPALSATSDSLPAPDATLGWVWRSDAAGAIALPHVNHPTLIASESSDVHAQPQQVSVPVTLSGRLATPQQADAFELQATKDQKLRLRASAKALGFPTDLVIAVLDESGKLLVEADDTGRDDRDPQVDFTAPADGRYRVLIRDLHGRGDLRMVYRLTIEPIQPDFSLALATDSFVLEKDKPLEIPVNVAVRDGLREPIEIGAVGLPAGITAEPVKFQPTEDAPSSSAGGGRRGRRSSSQAPTGPTVKLILKADPAAIQAGGAAIRIEGRTLGSSPLVHTARFPLNLPLAGSHHAVWLTVRK